MSIKIYVKYVKNNRDFHTTKLNLPTGNLDCDTAYEIMQIFLELKEKNGQSTILVTHDPTIASYADRVLFLQDGRFYGEYEKKSGTGNVDEILVKFRESQKKAEAVKGKENV